MHRHSIFNLEYPREFPGVPNSILNPRRTWNDNPAYDAAANSLMTSFRARATEMGIDLKWTGWMRKQ
jgi:phosphoenolpyruvate carboxykinase (ATP)